MIGDPLIILDKHREIAKKINSFLKNEDKFIICICGISGTGKSETSLLLQQELARKGKTSLSISLDDYYLISPLKRNMWRKNRGIDVVGLDEIDFEDLTRICYDFKNNRYIKYKRVHKFCPQVEHCQIASNNINYLIIEGLFTGALKKYNYGDLIVYLEGNPKQTFEFRKLRGKENEEDIFRKEIVKKEHNVICQLRRYADKIIEIDYDEII